ncbi:MAG: hypothetical protein JAZ19_03790 [Candidatus Thiodiazotropha taylori]|nr:hypothetical protein [Candidatus Thiodiazotropha taylori]
MKKLITSLIASGLLACTMLVPVTAVASGPNLMVFGDDADKDTVPRNSRVFKRVVNALRSQLDDKGFDVFDETAVTVKETADGEGGYAQGRVRRTDAEILDIAQSLKRPPIDVAVMFQIYASAKDKGYTTKVNTRIAGHMLTVQSGKFLGEFEVVKRFNAPADCNRECILEAVGAKSRSLAQDLGDVLSIKLAHLTDRHSGGGHAAGGHEGMDKEYSLVFNNFSSDERLDIEEYLVIFTGYKHHRPVDCSRRNCEYWYKSTISSARLNRNINRMMDQLGIEANIVFEGNTVRVDRITLREERGNAPFGGGW